MEKTGRLQSYTERVKYVNMLGIVTGGQERKQTAKIRADWNPCDVRILARLRFKGSTADHCETILKRNQVGGMLEFMCFFTITALQQNTGQFVSVPLAVKGIDASSAFT